MRTKAISNKERKKERGRSNKAATKIVFFTPFRVFKVVCHATTTTICDGTDDDQTDFTRKGVKVELVLNSTHERRM